MVEVLDRLLKQLSIENLRGEVLFFKLESEEIKKINKNHKKRDLKNSQQVIQEFIKLRQ